MSYGFSITNSEGKVLIADGEIVPRFVMKYAVPITSSVASYTVNTTIPDSEMPPLIFQAGGYARQNIFKSGGFWQVTFTRHIGLADNTPVAYIFGNKPSTNKFGIRVFNSNGKMAYESSSKAIRVVGVFGPGQLTFPKTFSVPIAVMPKLLYWHTVQGGNPPILGHQYFPRTKGSTASVMLGITMPANIGQGSLNVTTIAIDITGL